MSEERPTIVLDDGSSRLHATWSRSGKRLIVTVSGKIGYQQIELRDQQVAQLARFMSETVEDIASR
jgi:hypothetical protein